MSAQEDDQIREEDIIADLETGEVDPRIQARDRGEAARGEPIRVERDPGLITRARTAVGATAALPASFIEQTTQGGRRVVEAGRGVVERGQQVVQRGREIEEITFERLDRGVERVTGVDVPEARGRLRELDPFDRVEGRQRELDIVGRVRDPIAERAEPITEPIEEQLDRLGAGATVVGRGAQAVGTRVVAPVSAGIATIEALERLEESPGFRGEIERPEDRQPVSPTEQEVPDRPARGERAIEPELGVPESREPVIPTEQAVPERPAERAIEPEISVPEEQQQVDPTIVQAEQIITGREVDEETEIITGEDIAGRPLEPSQPERLPPEERTPTRRVRELDEMIGPQVVEEETSVRDPVEQRFEEIQEQRELVLEEEFGPRTPEEDPTIGTEPPRIEEETRIDVDEELSQISGVRERVAEQEELRLLESQIGAVDEATDFALDIDQLQSPDVGQEPIPVIREDELQDELELEDIDFDQIPELDVFEDSVLDEPVFDDPVDDFLDETSYTPPEFVDDPVVKEPTITETPTWTELPSVTETPTITETPTFTKSPPPRPRIPELDEYPDEQQTREPPGRFDFQLVTDLPAPGELDDLPAPPSMDADSELPSMEPPEFPDPP